MPDCDLDQAVNGLMGAAYGSAGERCMAQSVAVAVGEIGDKLVASLAKKLKRLELDLEWINNLRWVHLLLKNI